MPRRRDAAAPAPFNRRLLIAMTISVAGFGLLGAQAWHLQVKNFDKYHALAENNRITLLPLPPQRGRILDRNGIVLAEDVYLPALEIATSQVRNIDRLAAQLSPIVPITPQEIRRFKKLAGRCTPRPRSSTSSSPPGCVTRSRTSRRSCALCAPPSEGTLQLASRRLSRTLILGWGRRARDSLGGISNIHSILLCVDARLL